MNRPYSRQLLFLLLLIILPCAAGRARAPVEPTPVASTPNFQLLVEPLSTEWESRLVPSLLQNLLRIAPYTVVRAEAPEALRRVAETSGRLALLRRSSAAAETPANLELLEIGPSACMVLVARQQAHWRHYADLNYRFDQPLRVEAVSLGALRDFQRLLTTFPLSGEISLTVRPTHIAVQRLVAGDADLVILDVPRRGSSDQPADVIKFVMERDLRLLDLPSALFVSSSPLQDGEVVVYKGWFWEQPKTYRGLCDAFVLAMPTSGADQLVYSLYSGVAESAANPPPQPGLLERIGNAIHGLLVAIGILSP